jgi:hypothetical protein
MDWQEAFSALIPAFYGLVGAAVFIALFSAFLSAHPM